jgi:hypothetical protein
MPRTRDDGIDLDAVAAELHGRPAENGFRR